MPPEVPNNVVMVGNIERRSGILVPSRRPPQDKTHCTVIMMVGLPGAGKTTWVRDYLRKHPNEHWILLNTDTILDAMAVNGIPRRRVHQGRWDMVMGLTGKALNRSLQMACRRRHNYIIDQTNVVLCKSFQLTFKKSLICRCQEMQENVSSLSSKTSNVSALW